MVRLAALILLCIGACLALPSSSILGRKIAHENACTIRPASLGGPGDSFGKPKYNSLSANMNVRQLMRLSLLGASLLAGTQSSRAVSSSDKLCSTVNLDDIVRPPVLNELTDLNVVTRPSDDRIFKAITLKNDLRVLLVSDPSSSRCAAAMDVHVGSLSDPENIPGLAHFCEHMSFLGTKKFPEEEGFTSFLASHGGSSNAYTDNEDTCYYFDVNAEFLPESLDRFSQFFISPLFTESATNRELNAVDSEHAKNINSDSFRMYQLEKEGANPLHPFHKFATGNRETLETRPQAMGLNVRQALLDFHAEHYSSNQMTLCIVGKDKVSELEKMAVRYFEGVPNRKATVPASKWWGKTLPFLPQQAASLTEVVPVDEIRRLSMSWPITVSSADEREELLAIKPEAFVAHLIGHEGKGSLRSLLVAKGWANGVGASTSTDISDMQLFEVSVELTEQGLKHRDEIVSMVFAYIDLLKSRPDGDSDKDPIPEYIFQEVDALSRISFDYSEKSDPVDLASMIVTDMQQFRSPSKYLTGSRIVSYYPLVSQCEVSKYLSRLLPRSLQLRVVAREFEGHTTREGDWYGTKYNVVPKLEAETKRWAAVRSKQFPALALPQPNDLIPQNFDLIAAVPVGQSQVEREKNLAIPPTMILDDKRWSVWHKTDSAFGQPRTYAIISLAVPANKYDATFVTKAKLFSYCFLDSINEFLYDARLAGLTFELEFTSKGVQLQLGGFSDKLESFAERVLQLLKNFRPDEHTFARFKDLQERSLSGWRTQQPYYHTTYYSSLATETLQYPIEDLQKALASLKVHDISDFLGDVLKTSAGTALVMGNVDSRGAIDLLGAVDKAFPFAPLAVELRSRRYISVLPLATPQKSGVILQHSEPNTQDDNSAVTFNFQLPTRDLNETIYLELLADTFEQGFYNTLRTQEQLGYIVFSGVRHKEGVLTLCLTVQSNVLDGPGLTERIQSYIETAVEDITNISRGDFEAFKEGLRVRKLEPDQRLTSQATRLWAEVNNKDVEPPLFDRYIREVAVLDRLKQSDFNSFVRDILETNGARRRLLVSEINSTIPTPPRASVGVTKRPTPQLEKVNDEIQFRKSLTQL